MSGLTLPVLLATTLSLQGPASDERANTILARAAEAYREMTTLEAEFVQKIDLRAFEREKEGRGHVYQKKPNYFLMEFADPKGDIVVADGEFFWMYYPSAQPDQVIRTTIQHGANSPGLGGQFVMNPQQRYIATYVGMDAVGERPAHLLSLVPKFTAPYTLVRVWIDSGDYLVRKFEVYEENETIRTMTLIKLRVGIELPDSLFRFSPPQGVDVFSR